MTNTSMQLDPQALQGLYHTLKISCITAKHGLQKDIEAAEKKLRGLQQSRGAKPRLRRLLMGKKARLVREADLECCIARKTQHIAILNKTLKEMRVSSRHISVAKPALDVSEGRTCGS